MLRRRLPGRFFRALRLGQWLGVALQCSRACRELVYLRRLQKTRGETGFLLLPLSRSASPFEDPDCHANCTPASRPIFFGNSLTAFKESRFQASLKYLFFGACLTQCFFKAVSNSNNSRIWHDFILRSLPLLSFVYWQLLAKTGGLGHTPTHYV